MRSILIERILREADLEGQITRALHKIKRPNGTALTNGIRQLFKRSPEKEWRDHVKAFVSKTAGRGRVP